MSKKPSLLPLPVRPKKKPVNVEIEVDLINLVKKVAESHKDLLTDIVAWGLKNYIIEREPELAKESGLLD
jgi:hypothetical protein